MKNLQKSARNTTVRDATSDAGDESVGTPRVRFNNEPVTRPGLESSC
jgi:hypothetical protein